MINQQEFIDLGLQYSITPRWTAGLVVPFSISERSQLAPADEMELEPLICANER